MISGVDLSGKTVLEPSAGSGNIIDALKPLGAAVLACEINPDLAIIAGSKAKLIAYDFMDVTSYKVSHLDYIIMNPPFSADEKHILHAWEIAPAGCEIVALCNWNTIANTHTRERRQLRSIISDYGTSENLGDVFSGADRSTGAEIGLIKLFKPGSRNDFADYFSDEEDESEQQANALMSYNAVRDVVQRYVNAVKLYDDVLDAAVKMNALTDGLSVSDIVFTCAQDKAQVSRDEFAKELQKKSWGWVIDKMNLRKYSTRGLSEDINAFVEQQRQQRFTMRNVYKMLDAIIQTTGQRMDRALLEVFDNITKHYHDNRYNVEGWKTNSHYFVGQKFIIPYLVEVSYGGRISFRFGRKSEELEDMVKALCYITGTNYDDQISFYQTITGNEHPGWGEWFDWGFFEVKLFKKGTGHFKFKDENVWARFNQHIARIKGFPLPESMKGKAS